MKCLIASLAGFLVGCGGGGDDPVAVTTPPVTVITPTVKVPAMLAGNWVMSTCVKSTMAVNQPASQQVVMNFTADGKITPVMFVYSNALCTGPASSASPTPGSAMTSWKEAGNFTLPGGEAALRLEVQLLTPPGQSSVMIAVALKNQQLCFSDNVVIEPNSFGFHSQNSDKINFDNCWNATP